MAGAPCGWKSKDMVTVPFRFVFYWCLRKITTTRYFTKTQWTSHLSLSPTVEEIVFILSKYYFVERPWNTWSSPTFPPRARLRELLALGSVFFLSVPDGVAGNPGPGTPRSEGVPPVCSSLHRLSNNRPRCAQLGKIPALNYGVNRGSPSKLGFAGCSGVSLPLCCFCCPTQIPKRHTTQGASTGSQTSPDSYSALSSGYLSCVAERQTSPSSLLSPWMLRAKCSPEYQLLFCSADPPGPPWVSWGTRVLQAAW